MAATADFGRSASVGHDRYRRQTPAIRFRESPVSPQAAARLAAKIGTARRRAGTVHQMLSLADIAILATDVNGIIAESNRNACQLFGYSADEMAGLSVHQLLPPDFRQRHVELMARFVAGAETERRMEGRGEVKGYRKDGTVFPLEASIAKFHDGVDWMLVVTLRDITERKRAEDELMRRITHDALTGLPNRALIRERLANALQRSRRQGLSVALLFVDLDGFKQVNDTHGHEAGDALLKVVAKRLLEQVRPGDTVARLAGDEFVILCEQFVQPATISTLAERINGALRQPVEFKGVPLSVTASIGVAIGHGSTHTPDDLLRSADTAMYAVKEKGRDGWQFFNDSLQDQARQRRTIIRGLRLAPERNELSPRFQPIVAAANGRIVGAELLLRWYPPEGEVSPAVFMPIAETTDAIVAIGAWAFRQACRAAADWRRRWGADAPYVSVNVSARQLTVETLAEDFAAIIDESGADPSLLLLEITETALMADVEISLRMLRRLADLGLRVAVDDFGTGYSSLTHLTRLPVHLLKIAPAFVDGIGRTAASRAGIRAAIGLGRALGLELAAEGVANDAQLRELTAQGCDFIQGCRFHSPLEETAFVAAFNRDAGRR